MLINLSNHPAYKIENGIKTCNWDIKQMEAASEYGTIIDLPFPNVPPEYTTEDIYSMSLDFLHECEKLIPKGEKTTIHITGEVTFCFSLIQMLLKKGYGCIAATSNRNVTVNDDGDKVVHYEFKHFRHYKIIQL